MDMTRSVIEALAPDQSALTAASALLKQGKWPLRGRFERLIWGECQGSGANPYRVAADIEDRGSKCTCPSRKFPCKHALALMWMFVDDDAGFQAGDVPDWVNDWVGRRRKAAPPPAASGEGKNLDAAHQALTESVRDPNVEARRQAASQKRAEETRRSVFTATEDLDVWIADQLRTGLAGFLAAPGERCRRIAARLVDAKAGALASRIDEMPSRLLALSAEERVDAAIAEFGKLVLLARAWRAASSDAELRREVVNAETREEVLANPQAPRIASLWEVLGERVATRRDGLVSQATWLMNLRQTAQRFALLLDFFPASAGRRGSAFVAGERFNAELAFYPACAPLRAVIVARAGATEAPESWPDPPADLFAEHAERLLATPWMTETPLLLPEGRICADAAGRAWWRSGGGLWALLRDPPPPLAMGASIDSAVGIWDGARLSLLAAQTNWGRLAFNA
jgi:hypothetical protein